MIHLGGIHSHGSDFTLKYTFTKRAVSVLFVYELQ